MCRFWGLWTWFFLLSLRAFCLLMITSERGSPSCVLLSFFYIFQQNWLIYCLFLCFGWWLNSRFGGHYVCVIFFVATPACLFTLLHPSAPIFPHPWSFLTPHSNPDSMHNILGIFPAIHTENVHICTPLHPKLPFLIVCPLQHTPTDPTHPSTPTSNHNYIHFYHMKKYVNW